MIKHHIHGANLAMDIASEDVWSGTGDFPFQAAAAATTIVSASASDTAAGTGARTVYIEGIDANNNILTETVSLNGATPVNLVGVYLRINSAKIMTAGSGETGAGLITIKQSSTEIAEIEAGQGRARMAVFTPPNNLNVWRIKKWSAHSGTPTAGIVVFSLQTRKTAGVWNERATLAVHNTAAPSAQLEFVSGIFLDAGEDVRVRATSTADNIDVYSDVEIWGSNSANE